MATQLFNDLQTELAQHLAQDRNYVSIEGNEIAVFSKWNNYSYGVNDERIDYFTVVRILDLGKNGVNVWVGTFTHAQAIDILHGGWCNVHWQAHTTVRSADDISHLVRYLGWMGISCYGTEISDAIN